jgi:hypothetical protein
MEKSPIWAIGLVVRSLRLRDALLTFFADEVEPRLGSPPEKLVPEFREGLDITDTVSNDVL